MRKNSLFLIALFVLPLFVACEKDNSIQKSNLVGEWYNYSDNKEIFSEATLTINSDGTFIYFKTLYGLNGSEKYISYQSEFKGSLKLKGNRLSMKITKAQYRSSVGSIPGTMELTEWNDETGYSRGEKSSEISFLQNSSALLIDKLYDPHDDREELTLLLRKGTTLPGNNSDLQGTWYTYRKLDADTYGVDIAIQIDNDSIDMIINIDGARYVGKYTYENGMLSTADSLTYYTCWDSDKNNNANWTDPYAAPWRESGLSDPNMISVFCKGYTMTFIAEGETAYCQFASYAVKFTKQ